MLSDVEAVTRLVSRCGLDRQHILVRVAHAGRGPWGCSVGYVVTCAPGEHPRHFFFSVFSWVLERAQVGSDPLKQDCCPMLLTLGCTLGEGTRQEGRLWWAVTHMFTFASSIEIIICKDQALYSTSFTNLGIYLFIYFDLGLTWLCVVIIKLIKIKIITIYEGLLSARLSSKCCIPFTWFNTYSTSLWGMHCYNPW